MGTITFGNRAKETSNTDKVFFPGEGITTGDLIDYYRKIAPTMLPHMRGRPVMMHRPPDGIEGDSFYQKDLPDYFPFSIKRTKVRKKKRGRVVHALCNRAAALAYMANQGSVTFHLWLSREDRVRRPVTSK
jgi:bifunctional non-homologous end joining protein LigD